MRTHNDPLETFWDEEKQHSELRWGERVLVGTPEDVGACAHDIENMRVEIGSLRRSLRRISEGVREAIDLEMGRHGVRP